MHRGFSAAYWIYKKGRGRAKHLHPNFLHSPEPPVAAPLPDPHLPSPEPPYPLQSRAQVAPVTAAPTAHVLLCPVFLSHCSRHQSLASVPPPPSACPGSVPLPLQCFFSSQPLALVQPCPGSALPMPWFSREPWSNHREHTAMPYLCVLF